MQISIIIPTYNEATVIKETIEVIKKNIHNHEAEILVADAGSCDHTQTLVTQTDANLVRCPEKGRAAQMNFAASRTSGNILYFLHADTHPPVNFDRVIHKAVQAGYDAGCFQLSFDEDYLGLRFYSRFSRLNWNIFRFGDQSLFVKQSIFFDLQGFKNEYYIMEDQEFVQRLSRSYQFKLLNSAVTTSARKYCRNGVYKLQLIFTLVFCLYYLGLPQQKLKSIYDWLIK